MFKHFKSDFSASIIVFCVALPLCLGIALASGAPLFSGVIAGIVGGLIVGMASGSALGVSGPAAGLAIVVLSSVEMLGWQSFLLAVVLGGILQIGMGFGRAGFIGYFFPSSVIKGMLTGIGLLIILKQIPHAVGYDAEMFGSVSFLQNNGETTLLSLSRTLSLFAPGALIITGILLPLTLVWDNILAKKHVFFKVVQGPIMVIFLGVALNAWLMGYALEFALAKKHLVSLPPIDGIGSFFSHLSMPDFSAISNFYVWKTAVLIAIIASLETLLCVEATDQLDPQKRITPPNRELKAQGLGNIVSGLMGGLPITQVIVRSSANITFGGKTKLSAIMHGAMLLLSALFISHWLNLIPLASLAVILIIIGYKLANPKTFISMYKLGGEQFIPFISTVIGILATDLLTGIAIGMAFGLFYTLRHSYRNAYYMKQTSVCENGYCTYYMVLAEEVSFFNKASIIKALKSIPENSTIEIDCSNSKSIDYDVVEFIHNFLTTAKNKSIKVNTVKFIDPL